MSIKRYNPVTPGLRTRISTTFDEVTTSKPEKSLIAPMKRSGGRNNTGRMTMRYIGGGHKKRYRIIDFKRDKDGMNATVKTIEYDPNRTAYIALIEYQDGEKRYILAPAGIKVDDVILSGERTEPEVGNTMQMKNIPLGSIIHNIELNPGRGGVMARSAGSYAQLTSKDGKYVIVKLPSGEVRKILNTCKATIGSVSNGDHSLEVLGKAGRNRWKGRRPRTRGVAMNPIDHPMGGGEGRSSGGHPRSRKGLPAKGFITRDPKKASNRLIVKSRRKKK